MTDAFRSGKAAVCLTFQIVSAKDLVDRYAFAADLKKGLWEKVASPVYLLLKFAPRGWVYQNLVTYATEEQATTIESINPKTQLIDPGQSASVSRELEKTLSHSNPFNVLARIAIPNFSRAVQTTARNQTKADQAFIACGLERYHNAHGEYPETLAALVPQFVEKLPMDIIGGQPLKYRRTDYGQFVLYSIGWNEKDDGGTSGRNLFDEKEGDWVWRYPAK